MDPSGLLESIWLTALILTYCGFNLGFTNTHKHKYTGTHAPVYIFACQQNDLTGTFK